MDNTSQEPSSLLYREGTCKSDTVPSDKLGETLHSVNYDIQASKSVSSSFEAQGNSSLKVPKR